VPIVAPLGITSVVALVNEIVVGEPVAGVTLRKTTSTGDPLDGAAAAAEMLVWREEVLSGLRHKGVLVVDAFPDELSAPMVNQYLQVKAQHLL